MKVSEIKDCLKHDPEVLGETIIKNPGDYSGYSCEGNESNQLGCRKRENWICNSFSCWGPCNRNEKYSYEYGYINGEEIFKRLPENLAIKFMDNVSLEHGRVKGFYIEKDMLKYFTKDDFTKMIDTLTGYFWDIRKKIDLINEYILEYDNLKAQNKEKIIIEKYNEIFANYEFKFQKYDPEILFNFWKIYETLIEITKDKSYISNMETIFKVIIMKISDKKKVAEYANRLYNSYIKYKPSDTESFKKNFEEYF